MVKMKKLLFVIMMCVAVVANAQSWSKNLEKKAKKGDVEAQVAIGEHYLYANRVKKSTSDAAKWYNRATFVFCIPAMITNDAKYMQN